jgi:hypothetical protein
MHRTCYPSVAWPPRRSIDQLQLGPAPAARTEQGMVPRRACEILIGGRTAVGSGGALLQKGRDGQRLRLDRVGTRQCGADISCWLVLLRVRGGGGSVAVRAIRES